MSDDRNTRIETKSQRKTVDLYKNVNEGKHKYFVKRKLDISREIFSFKQRLEAVGEHRDTVRGVAQHLKMEMKRKLEKIELDKHEVRVVLKKTLQY